MRRHLGDRLAGEGLQLLARPGDPGPQVPEPAAAAARAHQRACLPAASADAACPARAGPPPRRTGRRRPRSPQARAGEQPRPAEPVQHADDPPAVGPRAAQHVASRGENSPARAGSSSRRSATSTTGHPPARRRPAPRAARAARACERRHGRHERAGHAGPAGPLDGDVAGVPGRRRLRLERLVVLVERRRSAAARHRAPAPTRPPASPTTLASPRWAAAQSPTPTSPAMQRDAMARRAAAGERAAWRGRPTARRRSPDPSATASATTGESVGGGREPCVRPGARSVVPAHRRTAGETASDCGRAVTRPAAGAPSARPSATPPSGRGRPPPAAGRSP